MWQVKPEMPQGSSRSHARRALPDQVKVADDQAPSILRLGELQQQGQALLPDGRDPGGQQGGQKRARVRTQHKQALVLLCRTQGTSASCSPRDHRGQPHADHDGHVGSVFPPLTRNPTLLQEAG